MALRGSDSIRRLIVQRDAAGKRIELSLFVPLRHLESEKVYDEHQGASELQVIEAGWKLVK